ncbi:hypothetical protein KF707_07005 [Candidatus Obscuribacterales bacterium]|nr:hypothetical protein [Candidatus Obscuribacterales bacterium]MBX3135967.1 hypothetical protein [Candidatus Obscuribacterales bacterium]MBX3152634.1 hypothetical protein [Candidatus Obscuribacterales bacterium]
MRRIELALTSHLANLKVFAIAGTLLLAATQPASARNDFSFRDFREQNPELGRHEARQAFKSEVRDLRQNSRVFQTPVSNTVPSADTVQVQIETRGNHADRVNNTLRNRSAQVNDSGQLLRLKSGLDLDLTSTQRNISLGKGLFADVDAVQITLGGETKTVHAGSLVSAAEYVAVKQVLDGGSQKVVIDRSGRASGGEVNLEAVASDRTALRASSLVIAEGVTTSGDFGRNSEFKLLGDLSNYGTLYAFSSDSGTKSGAIRAHDINNYKGATIDSSVDLTLDASGNLNNFGTISSTGSLTLTAAGAVNNSRGGSVKASGDINLQADAVNNQGTIESTGSNINLQGSTLALMNVDNNKGTLKALNGAINVRDASYSGAFDSYVDGGDLFSKEVNVHTGYGVANVYVNELTGVLNQYGSAAHIKADTDTLTLGTTCLTGDPTIYNTSGNINITADITVAENLVFVASGDIIVADNVDIFAGDASRGYEMNFIAGASFVPTGGGTDSPTVPPLTGAGGVDLNGKASKTGGGIIMGTNVTVTSRASNTSGDSNGDGILMVAFQGKTTNAGKVDISGATITTGGSGTGTNGSFFVLAAGTKGDVIKTGVIDTTGGSDDSNFEGLIGLYTVDIITEKRTFNPNIPDTGHVIYDANGVNISDYRLTGNNFSKGGNLIINDVIPGDDIKGRSMDLYGGGGVSILGQVNAFSLDPSPSGTSIDMVTNDAITSGPNGSLKSGSVIFLIATNVIGSSTQRIVTDAPDVEFFNNKGKDVWVQILGTGEVAITGLASSKGIIDVDASGRQVSSPFNLLSAGTVNIVADSLGGTNPFPGPPRRLNNIDAGVLNLHVLNGNIDNTNFGPVSAQFVTLTADNGSIGTNASLLAAPTGVKQMVLTAGNGGVFVNSASSNSISVSSSATGATTIFANGSLELLDVSSQAGDTTIQTSNGTLTVSGNVSAKDSLSIVNTNAKGKFAIDKNIVIATDGTAGGDGNILLSVGPNNSTPVSSLPANVTTNITGTGTVTITGGGIKAKSPNNVLIIPAEAGITVNNGLKSSNFTMGGGVQITATNNN